MITSTPRHQFLEAYTKIRAAEGRGSDDSAYYRALPFSDLTGRNSAQWRIRARTFAYFKRKILPRVPCDILDLGAGNCWLSHRLAELGHTPVAVDIFTDPRDGLRAARHYPFEFPVIESGFDDLPVSSARFDLAVFNSSIHYSSDYVRTLSEARRCLRPCGRVVILDSPVYERREHGEAMRAERQKSFERQYGFRSEALGSVEFFDLDMLKDLSRQLSITWEIHRPWYGLEWHLRPVRARLKGKRPPFAVLDFAGEFSMIILLHPRSTRPKNRRFPLSVLALAAVLEGKEEYEIVDGNADPDPEGTIDQIMQQSPAEALAVSLMPGPQMVSAVKLSKWFRAKYPQVPIIWGGYFPSLYADTCLNAPYVDVAVRGQGEDTLLELLPALREKKKDLRHIAGLSYRDQFGLHVHTKDRGIRSPGDFPWMPYHRLRHPEKYIAKTFLGKRTAVHHASYGCPFRCKFCGVTEVAHGRQKSESPERTASVLAHMQREYAIDSVQFYDNNFFLREDDVADLARRITPLKLSWWCEGRIDILLRYSDATMHALRQSGCKMIFLGAESGSDKILREMDKQLTSSQTLELAGRIRKFGIIPEFSFVIGNPQEPDEDLRTNMEFIRRLKSINPESEIIVQHYTPTPHPDGMYGEIDGKIVFPKTPEEWASPRWYNFTVRQDPALPWLPRRTKRLIDAFETVLACRWPTIQDSRISRWARATLKGLSWWRYKLGVYAWPFELEAAQKILRPRNPKVESV